MLFCVYLDIIYYIYSNQIRGCRGCQGCQFWVDRIFYFWLWVQSHVGSSSILTHGFFPSTDPKQAPLTPPAPPKNIVVLYMPGHKSQVSRAASVMAKCKHAVHPGKKNIRAAGAQLRKDIADRDARRKREATLFCSYLYVRIYIYFSPAPALPPDLQQQHRAWNPCQPGRPATIGWVSWRFGWAWWSWTRTVCGGLGGHSG
eukprot:SAG22_NODE_8000_length_692_cov_1.070826_1_plen_200_part_01